MLLSKVAPIILFYLFLNKLLYLLLGAGINDWPYENVIKQENFVTLLIVFGQEKLKERWMKTLNWDL